ncbi:MAG: glycosyltransferase family 4 protein [Verrucomicrobiia bacterium]
MKVLISAFACSPYGGTESYFGWSAVQCLAKDHDLWVLTSGRNRPDFDRALAEGLVPSNIRLTYANRFSEWPRNRMKAKLQNWTEYRDYSQDALALARTLHQSVHFDLVHHVTIATWRISSPLWRLGIPFVWGPISGNEQLSLRLYTSLSPSAICFELLRLLSNLVSRNSPSVRKCARQAAHIFATNPETEILLKQLRGRASGVSVLSPAFFSPSKIESFTAAAAGRDWQAPLRFFAGGMLEGRKGVALALSALSRLKKQGLNFSYHYGGGGPELNHLRRLADRLGLRENVVFGFWTGADYLKELAACHAYLLPSLRDSVGTTMMEAMLAGCAPIVADCGGPGQIVTEACGWKIPVNSRSGMIDALVQVLATTDRNRELLQHKGSLAAQRIATAFSEDGYRRTVNETYGVVLRQFRAQNNPGQ